VVYGIFDKEKLITCGKPDDIVKFACFFWQIEHMLCEQVCGDDKSQNIPYSSFLGYVLLIYLLRVDSPQSMSDFFIMTNNNKIEYIPSCQLYQCQMMEWHNIELSLCCPLSWFRQSDMPCSHCCRLWNCHNTRLHSDMQAKNCMYCNCMFV
jgi:hypothetical protein